MENKQTVIESPKPQVEQSKKYADKTCQIVFRHVENFDERRVEIAYARLFNIARKNILEKRMLTSAMPRKYTKV